MSADDAATILVGFGGEDGSDDALALARALAPGLDAELLVVGVVTYMPAEVGPATYEGVLSEETERFEADVRDRLGDYPARTRAVIAQSAAQALHDAAEEYHAEVIVVGSTHRGPLGRLVPGSVAERLLAAGPCAVAVAPRSFGSGADQGLRLIGVGWDGSPESAHGLRFATALAMRTGATVRLLSVVEPIWLGPAMAPRSGASIERDFMRAEASAIERRERALATALADLPAELRTDQRLLDGDPATQLVDASQDLDLLVIGSRGYGPLKRVLLGSVSAPVIRSAACPVIVVPRAAESP